MSVHAYAHEYGCACMRGRVCVHAYVHEHAHTLGPGDGADDLWPCPDLHDVGRLHPGDTEVGPLANRLGQHPPEAIEDDCTFASIDCGGMHACVMWVVGWVGG